MPHIPRPLPRAVSTAEADAWAETLVRRGLLHAALRVPTGHWLVQHTHDGPVLVLDSPAALLALVADFQGSARTKGARIR